MQARPGILSILCFVAAALIIAGCGDDDSTSAETTSAGSDPQGVAESTAACLTEAGLEPTVVEGELEGAAGIDLTTQNRTIVVQILPSEEAAADYKSASGLDQEQVGSAVILGGLVPPKTRQAIIDCLPSA